MMPLKIRILILPIITFSLLCGPAQTALAMGKAPEAPRITKEQLLAMMGNPDVVILDVREPGSWKDSRWKIKGAVREDPIKGAKTWAEKYPQNRTLVLYCS
jgi:hypothetical protein